MQRNLVITSKTLAPGWRQMYRHNQEQLEFEDFHLPFGGKLRSDNRWVQLAKLRKKKWYQANNNQCPLKRQLEYTFSFYA